MQGHPGATSRRGREDREKNRIGPLWPQHHIGKLCKIHIPGSLPKLECASLYHRVHEDKLEFLEMEWGIHISTTSHMVAVMHANFGGKLVILERIDLESDRN